jgi:hypothetical protein
MASSDDLKIAYQTIADCQALHPDPLNEMVDDDEVGSGKKKISFVRVHLIDILTDIDYDDDDQSNGNGHNNGNGNNDDDPYGYNAHFASMNQGMRGGRFDGHRASHQTNNQGNYHLRNRCVE